MNNTKNTKNDKPKKKAYECSGTVKENGAGFKCTVTCSGDNLEELLENVHRKLERWCK